MNIFCDTHVLVAATEASHRHHRQAQPVFASISGGVNRGFVAAYTIAETYAALTRLPIYPRIGPSEAERMIEANVLRLFQLVEARGGDYIRAMARVVELGLPGAKIYDALLL